MQASLAVAESHAVTADLWTSSTNYSCVGMTAHWLDESFIPHNKCLAVQPGPGSPTADFISSEVKSVLDKWSLGLQPNKLHIVTDSGTTVKKAMAQLRVVKWHTPYNCALIQALLPRKSVISLKSLVRLARLLGIFAGAHCPPWNSRRRRSNSTYRSTSCCRIVPHVGTLRYRPKCETVTT